MMTRLALGLAAVFASTLAFAQVSSGTTPLPAAAQASFDAGRAAAQRGEFDRAITLLLAADEAAPRQPRIALELGWVNAKAGHDLPAAAWWRCYLALTSPAELTAVVAEILADRVDRLIALTVGKTTALVREAVAIETLLGESGLQIPDRGEFVRLRFGITSGMSVRFEDRTLPSRVEHPNDEARSWRDLARVLSSEPTLGAAGLAAEIDRVAALPPTQVPTGLARIAARRGALLDRYEQLDMLARRPANSDRLSWAVLVAMLNTRSEAELLAAGLASKGYPAYVARLTGPSYQVLVGDFETRAEAAATGAKVAAAQGVPVLSEIHVPR